MTIKILTTGGTFDKVYFDALSEFHIGEPMAGELLEEANVTFSYAVESLLKKDSLEITEEDREEIRNRVESVDESMILITHGTDTMVDTAKSLRESTTRRSCCSAPCNRHVCATATPCSISASPSLRFRFCRREFTSR